MKYVEDRPYAKPEAAAQRLLELIQAEMTETGYAHAYTGTVNTAFTRGGGSVAEYGDGCKYGIEAGLFTIDDSGTRVKPGRHGLGWKRPPEQ